MFPLSYFITMYNFIFTNAFSLGISFTEFSLNQKLMLYSLINAAFIHSLACSTTAALSRAVPLTEVGSRANFK